MMFCPFQPEESVANYQMFWFPMFGYGLWVPRKDDANTGLFPPRINAPGNCTILDPDPSGNTAGPARRSDPSNAPMLTDVVTSHMPVPASGKLDDPSISFFNALPGGFYHFDPSGRVGPVNEGFADGHVERIQAQTLTVRYTQGPFANWR